MASERVYWRNESGGKIEVAGHPDVIAQFDSWDGWQRVHVLTDDELTAHDEVLREQIAKALSGPFDGTEGLDSFTLAWAIAQIERGGHDGE